MPMDARAIEKMIRDGVPGAEVHLDDLRGDGDHYAVKIISPAFRGLSRIQQHQLVYSALQGKMGGELHALSIRTLTPEQAMAAGQAQ